MSQHGVAYADQGDARWTAVSSRDPRADGLFYFGVTSTGIYCRPSCPARRPDRKNVVFFDDPSTAKAAGFRACKRCDPNRVPGELLLVARVVTMLQERNPAPTLTEMAEALCVSQYHLQRVFKRTTGLTPKQVDSALKAERFEALLRQNLSVMDALFEAGYGSSRALYERVHEVLGMSPSAYREGGAGERMCYTVAESSLGPMLVAQTVRGICALWWGEEESLLSQLYDRFPRASIARDDALLERVVERVEAYLGRLEPLPVIEVDDRGTDFQRRVWQALREIPVGETRTYAQIAHEIGRPNAARAVARACATNPVALFIPCHRILRSSGALAGYRWKVERKKALLASEQQRGKNQ